MTTPEHPGVRYARDVGPGTSGVRISLRRRLAEGGMGDLLGDLVSWQDGLVRVRDRHGTEHTVAEEAVVAAKRIPPPPPRRPGAREQRAGEEG